MSSRLHFPSLASFALVIVSTLGFASQLDAGPFYPGGPITDEKKLNWLQKRVRAKPVLVEEFCEIRGDEDQCEKRALDNTRAKLKALSQGKRDHFRILHLGDSHNASDLITGTIRVHLQEKYGQGGDGFSHVDQPWGFGGRRRYKSKGWLKDRGVDGGKQGRPYGFSWVSLESQRKNATIKYAVQPYDEFATLYYYAQPRGGSVSVYFGKTKIGSIDTQAESNRSDVAGFDLRELQKEFDASLVEKLDAARAKAQAKSPDGLTKWQRRSLAQNESKIRKAHAKNRTLRLVADSKRARFFGVEFTKSKGLIYDSIGPVGADAHFYLDLNQQSYAEHLKALAPDLVMLMVGGNDAMKVRKRWTNVKRVGRDHERVIDKIRQVLPGTEVVVWTPMDAGIRYGESRRVYSKRKIQNVRAIQRKVAEEKGVALFDLYTAMGGKGSMARWYYAGSMSGDLVHPRRIAGDLLGTLFVQSFMPILEPASEEKEPAPAAQMPIGPRPQ